MSKTERMNFEKKLAFHTAPTLLGAKSANLISLRNSEFNVKEHAELFNVKISSKGLKMRVLYFNEEHSLVLIYSEKLMKKNLNDIHIRKILDLYGYGNCCELDDFIEVLAGRIAKCGDFPHEIGLFLDYPLEDVIGYIANKGSNYKINGYWKVYGDEEKASLRFNNYNKCREYLCNKLNRSMDIYQALKIS